MSDARTVLTTFGIDSMPDLDVVVAGALDRFTEEPLTQTIPTPFTHPLIIGSGNALAAGRILYNEYPALFADESSVERVLDCWSDVVDGAVVVSASGGKHAIGIGALLEKRMVSRVLLTTAVDAPANKHFEPDQVVIFPRNREPYTYNTSTYFGMIFAHTKEDPAAIRTHIANEVVPMLPASIGEQHFFTFIVPAKFGHATEMIRTKFDELFGPFVQGRVFTEEEIKHAKTVVSSRNECFISLGVPNKWFGLAKNRIAVPLPEAANYGTLLAVAYTVVGAIQRNHEPYFKKNIVEYTERAAELFGHEINPIVE